MEALENDDTVVDVGGATEELVALPENQQKALANYYVDLAQYVTEECMDTMQANRFPVQLDRFVKEKGLQESIDYFVLDGVSGPENTYLYEVHFEGNDEAVAFIEQLQGQVSIEVVDGKMYIFSITVTQ